jgi:hypothetical protein
MKLRLRLAVQLALLLLLFLYVGRANAAISVQIQPGDQNLAVNQGVVFGAIVTTSAGEAVTGYQWFTSTNGGVSYTSISLSAALVISNVQLTNAGYYYVRITYHVGTGGNQTLSSTPIVLTVDPKPRILTQPADLLRDPGSNAVMSVIAAGQPPLTFQWRHDNVNLFDDSHLSGSSNTNLQFQNILLTDAGGYDLVVANDFGSVTSRVATLSVVYVPPIITSATNVIGKQGHAFNFAITASGTPPFTFGASGLPNDLTVNLTNGIISGIPQVAGDFNIALVVTNAGGQITNGTLDLLLADDIPVIVSETNAVGTQGFPVTYTIVATNDPAWFNAEPIPAGMTVDSVTGILSGTPQVSGVFPILIETTNAYGAATNILTMTLAPGAPQITSTLTKNGKQGASFNYTIKATNNPATYSAAPLPNGLTLDPITGVISGIPLVNGTYLVTIGSVNAYGSDSQTLTLHLASGAPSITSSLTAKGMEEGSFSYTIKANNSPTSFSAASLPIGLTVNTNTGVISGTPLYAGNYSVQLFAANAWGVGTATLQLSLTNLVVSGLAIQDVMTNYFSPYLLEFKFSLRDSEDPLVSHAVVARPSLMTVTAFEDGVPVSPSETGVFLQPGASKVLKGYLILDFTASVASMANGDSNSNGISDAVDTEVTAAIDFVNQQPADSQIGVYEFHRDDEAPQKVIGLTTDKSLLTNAIAGIWANYVQGFPAGSRAWDALGLAITSLGATNKDETHYIAFMSDGRDDSSTNTVDNVITAATAAGVQIYSVGFGAELDATTLQSISSATVGRYYEANDLAALALSFAKIGKDLSSQYVLRWATLKRSATAFMPTFQITYQGLTATSPANPPPVITGTNYLYVTNNGVIDTNIVFLYTTNYIIPPFVPTAYAGNVLGGFLRLVSDADVHPAAITLRSVYTPRYIRQLHLHYRANWPVTLQLDSTNSDEILPGWSLTQTNDGAGGFWANLSSPDPSNLATSSPFATFGRLLTFSFSDPINASNAFSLLAVDNTIYTNTAGTNFYGFTLTNSPSFITIYGAPPPPHGTPIPWLISYGITNNFDTAELLDPNGNGLPTWQDYIAGLNPTNVNSTFTTQIAPAQFPPQITFNTVINRSYRIEWATAANGPWTILRDGIAGTGASITFVDQRNLSLAGAMFYRVVVEGP